MHQRFHLLIATILILCLIIFINDYSIKNIERLYLKCPIQPNKGVSYDGGLRDQLANNSTTWGWVGFDH